MARLIRTCVGIRRFSSAVIVVIACSGLLGSSGCGDKPSEEQCAKLVDHMIELEIQAAGTTKLPDDMRADIDKQRRELQEYLRKQSIEKCLESLPTSVVECGLAAKDRDQRAACEQD